jgi:hypothetical protein
MKQKREKGKHDLKVGEVEFNRIQEGGQKCIIIFSIGQFQVGDDLVLTEVKSDICNAGDAIYFAPTGRTFKTFITDIIQGFDVVGLIGGYAILSLYGGGFLEMAKEHKEHLENAKCVGAFEESGPISEESRQALGKSMPEIVAETEEGRLP